MEKSDLEPSSKAQYIRLLMDIMREMVFLTDSRIVKFRGVADDFLSLSSPLSNDVTADSGPHGPSGTVRSEGISADAASSVAA